MSDVENIAHISLSKARHCIELKDYGRAFAYFLLFLKLKPENMREVFADFALASEQWFDKLETEKRLADLFMCHSQACELFPDHEIILNSIGAQLFRLGYSQQALACIRGSLAINPDFLAAQCNLENICSQLVERWHFSMLNDKTRNIAYKFAIQKAIKSGYSTVLDIGTGTGILSLLCGKVDALQITACEESSPMFDIAKDVLEVNDPAKNINLLNKHSTDLNIPDDLPQRVKLVVTETFDGGLFGEHIVSTLIHAWKNLISTTPTGTVIPCGATMYICGIECDTVRKRNRLLYPVFQHVDMNNIELAGATGQAYYEPYTTENLAKISGGYRILTDIVELLRVSFCNLCELESLYKGHDWCTELYVKRSGRFDAVAVWFDLHLDDTITLSTAADAQSCWEQTIYPVQGLQRRGVHSQSYCIKRKDTLRTFFNFNKDCLRLASCEVIEPLPPEPLPIPRSEESRCGVSVKECSKEYLPFRKRKVPENDSESDIGIDFISVECHCVKRHNTTKGGCDDADIGLEVDSEKIHHEKSSKMLKNTLGDEVDKTVDVRSNLEAQSGVNFEIDGPIVKPDHDSSPCCSTAHVTPRFQELSEFSRIGELSEVSSKSQRVSENLRSQNLLEVSRSQELSEVSRSLWVPEVSKSQKLSEVSINSSDTKVRQKNVGSHDDSEDNSSISSLEVPLEKWSIDCYEEVVEECPEQLTHITDPTDIEFINDIDYNHYSCVVLGSYLAKTKQKQHSLLYITPHLSLLGIQAAKMGYNSVTIATAVELHEVIKKLAAVNRCRKGAVKVVDIKGIKEHLEDYDVIYSDIVESYGALRQEALEDLILCKLTSLRVGGVTIPGHIKVLGVLIESEELQKQSHVTGDDRTFGFHIANFINEFQIHHHIGVNLSTLTYTKLSDVTELLSIDITSITLESEQDVLDLKVEKSIEVTESGKITACVYWFELCLDADTTVCTLDPRCHWLQAAIMVKGDLEVCQGQMLRSNVILQNTNLDVKIETCGNGRLSNIM